MLNILSNEELKKLTTKRLLAYKKSLMKVHETPSWDGDDDCKASPLWKSVYARVKAILATREHVERKKK
jgi:hypothetical protein